MARNEAYNCALASLEGWTNIKNESDRDAYLEIIILLAKQSGFFSTWMEVFKENEEIKTALIKAFNGTRSSVFCEQ